MRDAVMIAGTGSYLPEKILTNDDLSKIVDTNDEWIATRTGIRNRRIAAEDQSTSDLATEAAKSALSDAGMEPADIDLIIVATVTPDTLMPATACYVQTKLGAKKATAFDLSAACSGFLYAMKVAEGMIRSGGYQNALIIGAEKLSAFVDWTDRNTCVLFGDGAGAAVLRRAEEGEGTIKFNEIGTDGSHTEFLNIPGGGAACPVTPENAADRLACLRMEGREVFKHAVRKMTQCSVQALKATGLEASDLKIVVPHQANLRIIDAIDDRLKLTEDQMLVNLDQYGNTSAAAVAIALDEGWKTKRFDRGDHVLLVVFGAGFTWGSAIIEW